MKRFAAAMFTFGAIGSLAQAAQEDACAAPRRYVDYISQKNFDAVVALFAPDAAVFTPLGTVLHGGAEIAAFYRKAVAASPLVVRGEHFVANGHDCYFEIWSKSSRTSDGRYVPDPQGAFVRAAVDHFTVDDTGRVTEMAAFPAPGVSTVAAPAK
jgi:ketosteroid isomerase-like protein